MRAEERSGRRADRVHSEDGLRPTSPDPLAAVPDAVYRLDREGRFTYLNAAAEVLPGREAPGLLGPPALDCFPDMRGSVVEQQYRATLADGVSREFEFCYQPQNR